MLVYVPVIGLCRSCTPTNPRLSFWTLFTKEMVVALSAHLVAQRSDLITFFVTSLFLQYYKVSMFGLFRGGRWAPTAMCQGKRAF